MFCIFFLLANVLLLPASIVVLAVMIIGGFFAGLGGAYAMYTEGCKGVAEYTRMCIVEYVDVTVRYVREK